MTKNVVTKTWGFTGLPRSTYNSDDLAGSVDEAWQLPTGNYVTANLEPDVIFPKDDLTTNSYARHRNQPEGLQYNVKIGIKGGSYPHHYEIVSAPSGFTIGEDVGDANYGVMNWDSPTIGTHSIEISWADQDDGRNSKSWDTSGTIEFDLVVAASGSANDVYFDENDVGSSNLGTVAEPYNDWDDLWGATQGSSVNSGKMVFFRAGTHNPPQFSDSTQDKIQLTSNKPASYLAYPGEAAILDCSAGVLTPTTRDDIFFGGGLTLTNNYNDSTRAGYIVPNGKQDRLTIDDLILDGFDVGTGSSNNPGCLVFPDPTTVFHENISLTRVEATGNHGCVIQVFKARYMVVDTVDLNCSFTQSDSSNAAGAVYLKDDPEDMTCRNVTSLNRANSSGQRAGVSIGNQDGMARVEAEYCNLIMEAVADDAMTNYTGATGEGPAYWTRCTIFGIIDRSGGTQGDDTTETWTNCVVVNEQTPVIPTTTNQMLTDNLTGDSADAYISETTGLLIGSARTTYLGTRGHEVSA